MPAPTKTSLIDCVDEADVARGVVPRGEVFKRHAGFRTVHIFVFNPSGELLLQQLGRKRERNPLRWGSSVAGYLKHRESYAHAAVRRLREELDLRTSIAKYGSTRMVDKGCTKFITLYLTTATNPEINLPKHIEKIEFQGIDTIEERVRQRPTQFTETFRHMFRFYQATVGIMGETIGE